MEKLRIAWGHYSFNVQWLSKVSFPKSPPLPGTDIIEPWAPWVPTLWAQRWPQSPHSSDGGPLSPLIQVSSSQNWIENLEIAPWNPTNICHAQYIVTLCTNPLRKSTRGICLTRTSDKARTRRCGEVDVGMGKSFIEQRLQGCGNISALERGTKPKHLDPETRKNSTKGKTKIIRLCKCVPAHHRIAPWQTQPDQISAGCSADSFARPLAHDTQKELGRDHDIVWAPNQFQDHYLNLKLLIAWYWQGKAMHPGTPIHHIDRTW